MPCYSPLAGYRSASGGWVRRISQIGGGELAVLKVPCGQCIGCRLERSRQWAVRCVHEGQMHDENCFITLTYSDDHLPHGETLVKSDFQKFMKRLRKKIGAVRFFHCGEYGETTLRPHYHALLFGWRPDDPELFATEGEIRTYTSKNLTDVWGMGHATFGELTFESAAYVSRYCTKKVTGDLAEAHYTFYHTETGEIFQRLPEYSTQSRRPGIGKPWLDRYGSDVTTHDEVVLRGRAMRPPRYYDKVFEHTDPQTWETIASAREARREAKYPTPVWNLFTHDKPDLEEERRLHAGAVIAKKRLQQRNKA